MWEHHEYNRVGKGWSEGNPTSRTLQCEKQRAVCTVSGIAVDESSIVVGLGSSGVIQLWSRRKGKLIDIAYEREMPRPHGPCELNILS